MSGGSPQTGLHDRLAALLAPAALEILDAAKLEGADLELRVRPADGEQLAAVLAILNEHRTPALLRGGGSRLALGHPVPTARVLLETTGLRAEPIVDAEDGVAYLPAGEKLSTLCEHVHKAGEGRWEVPLDAGATNSTLGGALATAAPGPRSGSPRDAVLGLDVTLASGERTRCGGRVVKNVTGYDLAKLYLGSLGSLGVIEAAWLRLRPMPERRELWEAPLSDLGKAVEASRRPSVEAAGWWAAPGASPEGEGARLLLEIAGDAEAVEADVNVLQAEIGARAVVDEEGAGDRWAPPASKAGDLQFRVTSLPSGFAEAVAILHERGASVHVDLAHGLVRAHFAMQHCADPVALTASAFEGARLAACAGQGDWLLEAGPCEIRAEREVFGEASRHEAIFRALKAQYDPRGVLNPGRQAGRV